MAVAIIDNRAGRGMIAAARAPPSRVSECVEVVLHVLVVRTPHTTLDPALVKHNKTIYSAL